MSFNDMFTGAAGTGDVASSDKYMTKNGARTKFMRGKAPIVFSILPAFNPQDPDPSSSWMPSILPNGQVAPFGYCVEIIEGLGHGTWKDRCNVVCLHNRGIEEFDPVTAVRKAAYADKATWGYLLEDKGGFGDPNRVQAALGHKKQYMCCNVFLPSEAQAGAQVGIFSKMLGAKLVGREGMIYAIDPKASDEDIAKDYLAQYANGDITDPNAAPLFVVEKGTDNGEMSKYELRYQLDSNRRIQRQAATPAIMSTRYDISDPRQYLNVLTQDQQVELLIRELNGYSPAGYHEHALLRIALGDKFKIPEPGKGHTATVQSGFEQDPDDLPAFNAPQPAAQAAAAQPVQAPQPAAQAAPAQPVRNEMAAVMNAAVAAEAAKPVIPGDRVPTFDKAAFMKQFGG